LHDKGIVIKPLEQYIKRNSHNPVHYKPKRCRDIRRPFKRSIRFEPKVRDGEDKKSKLYMNKYKNHIA
jgi:hypothetical protein